MRWWICRNCNYIFEVETPPETCPSCHAERVFSDITRYIDEFGGLDNLDMKLVVKKVQEAEKRERKEAEQLAKDTVKLLKERMKRDAEAAKKAEEAEKRAQKEAERLAKEQAKKDAEADRKAQETEKRAQKEAGRLAKEQAKKDAEADRKAQETEKRAQKEAGRLAKEQAKKDAEADRKAQETEKRAQKEAERLAKEQAKRDAGAAKKAPEAEEAVPDIDSALYEGKIRLVIASPVGFEQVRQFQGFLEELENLSVIWVGGSADASAVITVSVQQPMPLLRSLSEIPMVQQVGKQGENIVVRLSTSKG